MAFSPPQEVIKNQRSTNPIYETQQFVENYSTYVTQKTRNLKTYLEKTEKMLRYSMQKAESNMVITSPFYNKQHKQPLRMP